MKWEGQLFIDTAQAEIGSQNLHSHGRRSRMGGKGVRFLEHYLNVFIVVGAPGAEECTAGLEALLETCKQLGMPIAAHKVEGPATCVTFLGIEVDAWAMVLRLPQDKLRRLKSKVVGWRSCRSC